MAPLPGSPAAVPAHHSPLFSLRLFLAGTLFTFALLAVAPVRHRPGFAVRAGAFPAAAAAHAVLAKSLWATGPPGTAFTPADLRPASQLRHYGGDAVETALALLPASQWYRAQGRSLRPRRGTRKPAPA
ncbi:cytochrome c oxidase assembly protein [Streptomyces coeruleorubidus]|uniref:cytochrome c oxidase assembly protein n=1 Tax=Streptomyces coeruleorubidus TaxID=116188 RepID=UPI0037014684